MKLVIRIVKAEVSEKIWIHIYGEKANVRNSTALDTI